jgi:hypothetical protein
MGIRFIIPKSYVRVDCWEAVRYFNPVVSWIQQEAYFNVYLRIIIEVI